MRASLHLLATIASVLPPGPVAGFILRLRRPPGTLAFLSPDQVTVSSMARVGSIAVRMMLIAALLPACTDQPTNPGPVTVRVDPASATMTAGESAQFTATVTGNTDLRVTWVATGGGISGTGHSVTYTAPDSLGVHTVTATSVADPTRSASITVTVTASQTNVLADRVPIPASGGEIVVSQPGAALDGLAIEVPATAFSTGTEWTVIERPDLTPALPEGFAQVGPAFQVRNGQGFADDIFLLKIPVAVEAEQVPVAFFYDPGTGHMELIPPVQFGDEDERLWVMTRHVSAANLLTPAGGAASRSVGAHASFAATRGTSAAFGEITIIMVVPSEEGLLGTFDTSFRPGVDDWEFINYGSYLSPQGFCAGSVITAMYHHYFRAATEGPLHGLYDEIVDAWDDNGRGIRLASVVQEYIDWKVYRKHIFDNLSIPIGQGHTFAYVEAITVATALKVTGLPQLVGIHTFDWKGGHALTVYGFRDGVFLVADPNVPGGSRELRWGGNHWVWGGGWEPFGFSERAGGPVHMYTRVIPVGASSLVDVETLAGYWRQFDDGTIGDAEFPDKTVEYRDPSVSQEWRTMTDTVRTAGDTLTFRWQCPTCRYFRDEDSSDPRQLTVLMGPGPTSLLLGEDGSDDVEGVNLLPEHGYQRVGVGNAAWLWSPEGWGFTNFDWITVHRITFELSADKDSPEVDDEVTFTVEGDGLEDVVPRLRWDFGDGTKVETSDGYEVVHAYSEAGAYEVSVELLDEDGVPVARARMRIGSPAEVWVGEATYVARVSNNYGSRERRFDITGVRFEPAATSPAGMRRFAAVAGEVSYTASGYESLIPCSYNGIPASRSITTGDLYFLDDDSTDSEASVLYGVRGYFDPPFVVTVMEECSGFPPTPFHFPYEVWLRTHSASTWEWLPSNGPDLLEGSASFSANNWTYTWTWRFERLRGSSEP